MQMVLFFASKRRSPLTRDRILALLEKEPGTHKALLAQRLGIAASTLEFHLHRMERRGDVDLLGSKRETYVFPKGMQAGHLAALAALNSPGTRDVASRLAAVGKASIRDIHQALDIPRAAARRRLRKLLDSGLAERGPKRRDPFEATEALHEFLKRY